MHAIVKVVGVTPEAIAKLHAVLKQSTLQTVGDHYYSAEGDSVSGSAYLRGKRPYAVLMDSKLHQASGTYTVSIQLNLAIPSFNEGEDTKLLRADVPLVFAPLSAFAQVLKSIDTRLVPKEETLDKGPEMQVDAIEALVEKLHPILGEKSDLDIRNSETGGIMIPANRKITRTQIRHLAANIRVVEFDATTDHVLVVLERVRDGFLGAEKK